MSHTTPVSLFFFILQTRLISYNQTTCSQRAFERGSGQKVVAYSFYTCDGSGNTKCGTKNNRGYLNGIELNLALVTKHYPG